MPAWDLSGATATGNFSVASQEGSVRSVAFSSDGTKMYIVGLVNKTVYQYTLSTAWDVTTASYASLSASVSAQANLPEGIFFKDDGSKLWVVAADPDFVYQYSLSTPWDISTLSYDSVSLATSGQDTQTAGIYIRPDGAKYFTTGQQNVKAYRYSMGSAWSLSGGSYDSNSISVNSQDTQPTGVHLKDDGTVMFIAGSTNSKVFQYALSSAWDLSTATYSSVSFTVGGTGAVVTDVFFKPDGSVMYVTDQANDRVYQYRLAALSGARVRGFLVYP